MSALSSNNSHILLGIRDAGSGTSVASITTGEKVMLFTHEPLF